MSDFDSQRDVKAFNGLDHEEAEIRKKKFGANEIRSEKGRPVWVLWWEQFKSPLVVLLIFASILSGFLDEWMEAYAIAAILILNAIIGFFQEFRAETAIEALKGMTNPRAKVIRQNRQTVLPAKDVVPDDLLLLEAGDIVAADAKILRSSRLQVNESILTGESVPVEKRIQAETEVEAEKEVMVFMGTVVSAGTALVQVSAIGMSTELGKIAHLITTAETGPTPLQKQMMGIGKMLLWICLAVVALVIVLGVLQQRPWMDLIIFSISLAVAVVPEGLPAIVTVALALGVQRLSSRNALIRKLPSVETLGSVSVICTDKTGTLTTGKMKVRDIWGEDRQLILETAAACCDAELGPEDFSGTGDPTELAILQEARVRGIDKETIEKGNPRISEEPFDSERKRMSIFRKDGHLYVKGAIESVLPLCVETPKEKESCLRAGEEMSSRGLRVLAVARGTERAERNLKLLGLIGIADPPRSEVIESIREARKAGILSIMITGDHPRTAAAIARELGLVMESEPLEGRVHARATPEDKLKLVREWKSKGHVVAMTGDGVNDAPALREAHIGIAMGRAGTEVTRQAADLVLADDNFATIVTAIREGRGLYQNIRKAIVYLLTGNFAELVVVFGTMLLGLPLPFTAAHLLWINLVTDSLPGLALIADPVSPDIMKIPPRSLKEKILGKRELRRILFIGLLEATIVLGIYYFVGQQGGIDRARAMSFTTFVFSQLLRSFGARSRNRIFWQVGALNNLWLLGVVFLTAILQVSLHFIPLGQKVFGLIPLETGDFMIIFLLSLIPISLVETEKIIRKWRSNQIKGGTSMKVF